MRLNWSVALLGGASMLSAWLTMDTGDAWGQDGVATSLSATSVAPRTPALPRGAAYAPAPARGDGVVPASTAASPLPPSPTIPPQPAGSAMSTVPAPAQMPAVDPATPRSYFRPTPPPPPPSRLGRFRQRMRTLMGTDRDNEGNVNEHIPYDPSTGRATIPAFSRPWLKAPGGVGS